MVLTAELCVMDSLVAPQLTSQDKTAQVIQRALEKHHLEHMSWEDFSLAQVTSPDRGERSHGLQPPPRAAC